MLAVYVRKFILIYDVSLILLHLYLRKIEMKDAFVLIIPFSVGGPWEIRSQELLFFVLFHRFDVFVKCTTIAELVLDNGGNSSIDID